MQEVGRNLPRLDAAEKTSGRATYIADIYRPGMLHGAILKSPYAHARILSYDTSAALAVPGVACVLTGNDVRKREIWPFHQGRMRARQTEGALRWRSRVSCGG